MLTNIKDKLRINTKVRLLITILLCILSICFLFCLFNREYSYAMCLFLLLISFLLIYINDKYFTNYEKSWFIITMILACIMSLIYPEDDVNGVNGVLITFLYLLDTFLNILCELLISKQSRFNFVVSLFIEITEIVTCIILMYRFASIATTLFFWIPVDIISYISWSKHKDEQDDSLTIVRRLSIIQRILVIIGVIILTLVIGYIISGLNIQTDFIINKNIETFIIYLDSCVSIIGICNGLFILFRLQEQWITWYIYAILEGIINILSGQYVLLILKLAYITNTTYGYIKWNRYINNKSQ